MQKIIPPDMALPARTISGRGAVRQLAALAAAYGRRGMLVHGASLRRSGALDKILANCPAGVKIFAAEHPGGEPTLDNLADLLAAARRSARIGSPRWAAAA